MIKPLPLVMLLSVAMFALLGTGCVAQREADDLRALYRKSEAQRIDLQARLQEAEDRIAALQAAAMPRDPNLIGRLEEAIAERDRLAAALADAEERLRQAGQQAMLPPELDRALLELAASDPNLMTYDPDLGMIRFRSDLTFALGSIEIRQQARDGLRRLAEIVRSEAARPYEVRIVGHTDNVPVTNPANRQRFRDNWGLSVWRAISVKDVLEQAGVPPVRMSVAGYGEFHPVVPNTQRGAEGNRRVEIFLVPSKYTGIDPQAQSAPPAAPAPTERQPAPAPAEGPEMFK